MQRSLILAFVWATASIALAQPFNTNTVSFRYERGSAVPPAQTISLGEDDRREVQVLSIVGSWLKATATNDPAPAKLRVSVDPSGLVPGIYEGSVVMLVGGDFASERVQLVVVDAPSFLIDPKSVSLNYTLGGTLPEPATVYVSAYNQPVRFTAESNAKWLLVTPASAGTPANLRISIDPATLTAGEYTGIITLKSDRISATIPVTLTVRSGQPLPPSFAATDVLNQASMTTGAIAPGELIIVQNIQNGPTEVGRTATNPDMADTLVAGTRLLFDGVPAPVLFVVPGQVRGIVPYSLDGRTTVQLQVEVNGRVGPAVTLNVVPASPGIFSTNMDGKGQAVAAHYNPSAVTPTQNTPQSPVRRGGILLFFLTGGGQTVPGAVTGQLRNNTGTLRAPVAVTIGGTPADIVYAGPAPGQVAGISQINARVAAGTPVGTAVPLVVTINGVSSTGPITVAVSE